MEKSDGLNSTQRKVLRALESATTKYQASITRTDAARKVRDDAVIDCVNHGIPERLICVSGQIVRGWIFRLKRQRNIVD